MNKIIDAVSLNQQESEKRVNGIIDHPSATRIAGWAIDRSDPNSHVEVDIYFEGELIGNVLASDYRKDLQRNGIGTGKYGFKFELSDEIGADMSFAISAIARTKDGCSSPLRNTGRAAQSVDPIIKLCQIAHLRSCLLRQEVAGLAKTLETFLDKAGPESEQSDVLERIELVQARLEIILPQNEMLQPVPQLAGLKRAVFIALLVGITSLLLGIMSFWLG